jgi:hypothetical protein
MCTNPRRKNNMYTTQNASLMESLVGASVVTKITHRLGRSPQLTNFGGFVFCHLGEQRCRIRLNSRNHQLRPDLIVSRAHTILIVVSLIRCAVG